MESCVGDMAAKVSCIGAAAPDIRDIPTFSTSEKDLLIESLSSKVFDLLKDDFLRFGCGSSLQARSLVDLTHAKEDHSSTLRSSIFDHPHFPSLSSEQRDLFMSMIQSVSCHSETFLLHALFIKIVSTAQQLEQEMPKPFIKDLKHRFLFFFWETVLYFEAKDDVLCIMKELPHKTHGLVSLLRKEEYRASPSYLSHYFDEVIINLSKISRSSKSKDLLVKELMLFQMFLRDQRIEHLLFRSELASFQEFKICINRMEDLLPITHFACLLLQTFEKHKIGFILLDDFKIAFEGIEHEIKELLSRGAPTSRLTSKKSFQAILDRIYMHYVHIAKKGTFVHTQLLRVKNEILEKDHIDIDDLASKIPLLEFISLFNYFMQKVTTSLSRDHHHKMFPTLSRMNMSILTMYFSPCFEEMDQFPSFSPMFQELYQKCRRTHFLDVDESTVEPFLKAFFFILMPEYEYEEIKQSLLLRRSEDAILFAVDRKCSLQSPVHYQRKDSGTSSLYFLYDHNIKRCMNYEKFSNELASIHKLAIELVQTLSQELISDDLQDYLRFIFFDALKKQLVECLLYRDLVKLLDNVDLSFEEVFPEPLIDMLSFELPGLFQKEEEEIVGLAEDLSLDDEPAAVASQDEARAPSPIIALAQEKPVAKTAEIPDSHMPSLQDFKHAKKYRQVKKLLKQMNIDFIRSKGSHMIFGEAREGQVVVPRHSNARGLALGTRLSIFDQVVKASGEKK
jgi:predicted RNA binding protein YcfA (HicA-like mRNA interferase family)